MNSFLKSKFCLFAFTILSTISQLGAIIPDFVSPTSRTTAIRSEWNNLMRSTQAKGFLHKNCPTICIDSKNMPILYSKCTDLTDKLKIATPMIIAVKRNHITNIASFLHVDFQCNAFAAGVKTKQTCLSAICIGVDLLENLTDSEIETIIAHELQSINHNHIAKKLLAYSIAGGLVVAGLWNTSGFGGFVTVGSMFSLMLGALSQGFVIQADVDAALLTEKPCDLANALYKKILIKANKLTLAKWAFSLISFNPLLRTRVKKLDEIAKAIDIETTVVAA